MSLIVPAVVLFAVVVAILAAMVVRAPLDPWDEPSFLDRLDGVKGNPWPSVEDLCMVLGCVSPWEHDTAGWRECSGHAAARNRV